MSLFDNEIFPLCASKGVEKTEVFPVDVQTNGINEYRSTPFDWEYFTWSIPSWNILDEDRRAIAAFLRQRKQGLRSFKYQDPNAPELVNNILPHHSGSKWKLTLAWEVNVPGTHPIFHPGALRVTSNGASVAYTFAIEDGFPIITIPGTSSSNIIRVSGPVYYAVRLSSSFGWTINALNSDTSVAVVQHTEIQLKEVFEY